jgi:TetR/AcrR family transcriptional regulator
MGSTRDRIFSVALSLFAERGYNAVGVQDVCETAEITKPTLYYHFGNKRGLLEAIAAERYGTFAASVESAGVYRGDVAASLASVMGAFLASARAETPFTRLRLALAFSPPASEAHAVFRPYTERLYAAVRTFFREAAKDHGNMAGRDLPYAASFIGTADAYVGLLLAGALDPDDFFVRRVVHHYMHGIFS